jgi:tetraacyldisaccharide 4'-kinase
LIRGQRRGCLAGGARGLLSAASLLFRTGAGLRGLGYDLGLLPTHSAPLPVISVGNLSVGGTGKTPLVALIARSLVDLDQRPGVLARGYGAERDGELNDELRLIGELVPEALIVPGRDRVARAHEAAAQGASVLVLDDGFQHRRLRRDADLVLLDASEPFGFPPRAMLPRGLLRESPGALRRAHAVVLTRAELSSPGRLLAIEDEVRRAGFRGPVLRMHLVPTRLRRLDGLSGEEAPASSLAGASLLAACGVGNPAAFAATLSGLGGRLSELVALPDHHAYGHADVTRLEELAARRAVPRIVVTAKDAVKLRSLLTRPRPVAWQVLDVEARVTPESALERLLSRLICEAPPRPAAEEGPTGG